jgi:hypothetical protein
MKNKDINAKLGNLSNGGKNGVCKDFKDIWKLMDLVQELQNSERTLPTNGQNQIVESGEDGKNDR